MSQSANHSLALSVILAAAILGGFFGLQLHQYLDVACNMRGECYGRTDWVYVASLIPIHVITVGMVSAWLLLFSLFVLFAFPLEFVQKLSLLKNADRSVVRRTAALLFFTAVATLVAMILLGAWFAAI